MPGLDKREPVCTDRGQRARSPSSSWPPPRVSAGVWALAASALARGGAWGPVAPPTLAGSSRCCRCLRAISAGSLICWGVRRRADWHWLLHCAGACVRRAQRPPAAWEPGSGGNASPWGGSAPGLRGASPSVSALSSDGDSSGHPAEGGLWFHRPRPPGPHDTHRLLSYCPGLAPQSPGPGVTGL